ncbi:hypothetical protein NUM3379_01030 [Kineococcus sp. NUM-3379]
MSIEAIGAIGGAGQTDGTSAFGFGQRLEDIDSRQMTRGVSDTVSMPNTAVNGVSAARAATGNTVSSAGGADFASLLAGGLDKLQGMQSNSDALAVKAATGNLTNVHDYMIASNETQLATQLTVAVRNKAVEAFNEIMRMQL